MTGVRRDPGVVGVDAAWQSPLYLGASVIAWRHAGVTQANPSEKTRLMEGDIVVLLGSRAQIGQAMRLLVQMGAK